MNTTSTVRPARGRTRSTTRQALLRLVGVLLVLTVAVSVTSIVTFSRTHNAADVVDRRAAPAIVQLAIARAALVKADAAAITSLRSGATQVAGPGQEFQNQIAIASQSLTRIAETNMAGEQGSRSLQFVEGLLVTYAGLIGEAAGHSGQQEGGRTVSVAALWSASRLLHEGGENGILDRLNYLTVDHLSVLRDEHATNATTTWDAAVLFGPIVALFAMLLVAQVFLRRRFRRRFNPWLLTATVLLVALTVVSSLVFVSGSRLDVATGELQALIVDMREKSSAIDAAAQHTLGDLLDSACGNAACSDTITFFRDQLNEVEATADDVRDPPRTDEIRRVNDQTAAASANAGLVTWIAVASVLIAASVLLGFRSRLIEYRYRSR